MTVEERKNNSLANIIIPIPFSQKHFILRTCGDIHTNMFKIKRL